MDHIHNIYLSMTGDLGLLGGGGWFSATQLKYNIIQIIEKVL